MSVSGSLMGRESLQFNLLKMIFQDVLHIGQSTTITHLEPMLDHENIEGTGFFF